MPVVELNVKDFTNPIFSVRTLGVLLTCATFILEGLHQNHGVVKEPSVQQHVDTFRIFCMFTWCFFFTATLSIHLLTLFQIHRILPVSWKNLTVTVAVLGALMCLGASVVYLLLVVNLPKAQWCRVAAAVTSCLTVVVYSSETYILICVQPREQRGYMARVCGVLKILQLWGNCQMIPFVLELLTSRWQLVLSIVTCSVCILMSVTTLVVIYGDFARRCLLPFDRFLIVFSLVGVLLNMAVTVVCVTKTLQRREEKVRAGDKTSQLVIMETVVAGITLLAYTMDFALSIIVWGKPRHGRTNTT